MSVLIISKESRSLVNLSNFFQHKKIKAEAIPFSSLDSLSDYLKQKSERIKAIVFDRIHFELEEVKHWLDGRDCFFIVENFQKIGLFGDMNGDMTVRFYFHPLNYGLLADDIKSITGLKDYMEFGKIDLRGVELNLNNRTLSDGKKEVMLRNKEYELLLYMARNRGRILSRINILENVWDMNSSVVTNTVDVHISKVRRILRFQFGLESLIRTVPCSGYVME